MSGVFCFYTGMFCFVASKLYVCVLLLLLSIFGQKRFGKFLPEFVKRGRFLLSRGET